LYDFLNSSFEICFNSREVVGNFAKKSQKAKWGKSKNKFTVCKKKENTSEISNFCGTRQNLQCCHY